MAGDWIKMQICLPDKPEVWQIAEIVGIDPDAVIGKLLRVWAWFDTHTEDGNAVGVTFALVDRISGVTGFAEAMSLCGWLEQRDINLILPKFSRHNGSSAKTRALTNDRVAKTRSGKQNSNAESNATTVTKTVTREEKRREDITDKPKGFDVVSFLKAKGVEESVAKDWISFRKTKKAAPTETAINGIYKEACEANITLNQALVICCSRGWTGFEAKWINNKPGFGSVNDMAAGAI